MKHSSMDLTQQSFPDKNDESVQLAIKRKWQIALRRYVLENNPSVVYAPHFGLTAADLKKWIQIQFTDGMSWENFGKKWNLSQKVPAHLFNLIDPKELSLCWHFINITVQNLKENQALASLDMFSTKQYFNKLFEATSFDKCKEMIVRITELESTEDEKIKPLVVFIRENEAKIEALKGLDPEDFVRLNKGESLQSIVMEKEIIKKYGS